MPRRPGGVCPHSRKETRRGLSLGGELSGRAACSRAGGVNRRGSKPSGQSGRADRAFVSPPPCAAPAAAAAPAPLLAPLAEMQLMALSETAPPGAPRSVGRAASAGGPLVEEGRTSAREEARRLRPSTSCAGGEPAGSGAASRWANEGGGSVPPRAGGRGEMMCCRGCNHLAGGVRGVIPSTFVMTRRLSRKLSGVDMSWPMYG